MIKSPILIMDDNELQLWTFKKYTGGRGAPGDGLYDGGGHHRDGRDVSSTSSSWSSSSRTSARALHRRLGLGDPRDPVEAHRLHGAFKGDLGSPVGQTVLISLERYIVRMRKGKIWRSHSLQSPPWTGVYKRNHGCL